MFEYFLKDFTEATTECRRDFNKIFQEAVIHCDKNVTSDELCLETLILATKSGEDCFHQEERFEDQNEWQNAGIISALHCTLPIVFAFCIWMLILKIYDDGLKRKLFRFPIPAVTKVYKAWCYMNMFRARSADEENSFDEDTWKEEADIQAKIVIISMIIEAAIESGFQFWFQSIYLMPTLILSFIGIGETTSWTDLFNWRLFSIAMSFYTFAWTFYSIRLN